jgi:large subunit ribosomal protein L22
MAETLDIRAVTRFLPMSPQKVRLVMDLVRGMSVMEALDILQFTPNAAAKPVAKLIKSAIANAEENFGLNRDDLIIHKLYADKGPIRRWRRFGARLRFKPIQRRYSHLTVILREREEVAEAAG